MPRKKPSRRGTRSRGRSKKKRQLGRALNRGGRARPVPRPHRNRPAAERKNHPAIRAGSAGDQRSLRPRWMLDKSIFAQRMLTEGGIMIDGSGSMKWTDNDMKLLIDKLPAVTVGLYSGAHGTNPQTGESIYGRICTIAKNGKFAKFTGRDPGTRVGNEVDYEALQLLAKWPEPRLWLSDGIVCGGLHHGPCPHPEHLSVGFISRVSSTRCARLG
jgi:hypothetical protein